MVKYTQLLLGGSSKVFNNLTQSYYNLYRTWFLHLWMFRITGSPQFDCSTFFLGVRFGPSKRQPAEKTAECKAALVTFEYHVAMTIWNVPYSCLSFAVNVDVVEGLRLKIMLSFGLGSQNSKKNQQIQYKFNILEKDVSNTTKIWRPAWLQKFYCNREPCWKFWVPFWCVALGFSTNSRICLRWLWKVKHFLPNGGYDSDLPW